ncbi:MAG: hypothetical protein MUF18_12135 [Fimbriiglobus sp.]|jgi:hypothetical protein|nr:hypothetical protein [Fimbriiglobus sp.]
MIRITLLFSLVVLLCAYWRFARQPRVRTSTSGRLREVTEEVARDEDFLTLCEDMCETSGEQMRTFRRLLRGAVTRQSGTPLGLFNASPLLGGKIGLLRPPVAGRRYGLDLPHLWPDLLLYAATVHELLHLIRHVRGDATFEREAAMKGLAGFAFRMREERIVWQKSFMVAPVGTSLIVFLALAFWASLPFFVHWCLR